MVPPMKQMPRVPETFTVSTKKKMTDALTIRRDDTKEQSRQRVRDLVKFFDSTVTSSAKVCASPHTREVDLIASEGKHYLHFQSCCLLPLPAVDPLPSVKLILEVPLQTQKNYDSPNNLPHGEKMSRARAFRRPSRGFRIISRTIKVGIVSSCIACYMMCRMHVEIVAELLIDEYLCFSSQLPTEHRGGPPKEHIRQQGWKRCAECG